MPSPRPSPLGSSPTPPRTAWTRCGRSTRCGPRLDWPDRAAAVGAFLAEHLPPADRLEGVADVLDLGAAAVLGPDDGDDIEAAALLEQAMAFEEVEGGQCQPPLLLRRDSLRRRAPAPGFHLDED